MEQSFKLPWWCRTLDCKVWRKNHPTLFKKKMTSYLTLSLQYVIDISNLNLVWRSFQNLPKNKTLWSTFCVFLTVEAMLGVTPNVNFPRELGSALQSKTGTLSEFPFWIYDWEVCRQRACQNYKPASRYQYEYCGDKT